ncbi:MAG TPA: hypothetical protein GX704_04045 [Clostridiales bacterium]|nr:hypothetical protein [Clostridiales bacterium]
MKRLIAVTIAMLFILCACGVDQAGSSSDPDSSVSGAQPAADDEILLAFEGAESKQLTRGEFLALEQLTVELTRTNSKGETTTGTYQGVHWSVLAEAIGAEDAQSVEVVASDGFGQAYTMDVLTAADSVFALYKDGDPITEEEESGQIWFCAGNDFTANYWSKYVVKIVVK